MSAYVKGLTIGIAGIVLTVATTVIAAPDFIARADVEPVVVGAGRG